MAYTPIDKSTDYFNTKLYSGTGAIQTVSGVGFEPSWIWTKSRTNLGNNQVTDQVRGLTKYIRTNANNAEDTKTNAVTAVNSDGFVLGADSSNDINASGQTYASWNWKANGQGSANTDGSINTTYTSVDTTSGFSISTYTGTGSAGTIGHGLGAIPSVVLVKKTSAAEDWVMYHKSLGNGKNMRFNTNEVADTSSAPWNATTPTSSAFSVGASTLTNGSSTNYIAYCFAEVQGFSKMGSYTGNANVDGGFIYTGFKPAWVLIKNTAANESWFLYDNKRGYNGSMAALFPNETAADAFANNIDLLSNGFKLKTAGAILNSNATFIYTAFAAAPLVGSNNVPANAR